MNMQGLHARTTLATLLLLAFGLVQFADPAPAFAIPVFTVPAGVHAATPASLPTASSTPEPPGADLGVPTNVTVADSVSQCGEGFVTQSEVLKCPSAIAKHQLVFVWSFDPSGCAKKPCAEPDGFNLVRSVNGEATTFATAAGVDRGVILKVAGDDVIGSCFYVLAYRDKDDFGRKSAERCIYQYDHLVLKATRVGSAHSYSDDDGNSCKSPSSNPVGYGFVYKSGTSTNILYTGYLTRSGGKSVLGDLVDPVDTLDQIITIADAATNVGNGTCNHYRDIYQGLFYFDLSPLVALEAKGKKLISAKLALGIAAGAWNAGSATGGDGTEHTGAPAPNCAATIGFPKNVDVGRDYAFPNRILFDTYANIKGGVGMLDVNLTGMVDAWLRPGGVNRGVVMSPSYLDPTHPPASGKTVVYNADCMSRYGTPELSVTMQ